MYSAGRPDFNDYEVSAVAVYFLYVATFCYGEFSSDEVIIELFLYDFGKEIIYSLLLN